MTNLGRSSAVRSSEVLSGERLGEGFSAVRGLERSSVVRDLERPPTVRDFDRSSVLRDLESFSDEQLRERPAEIWRDAIWRASMVSSSERDLQQ